VNGHFHQFPTYEYEYEYEYDEDEEKLPDKRTES